MARLPLTAAQRGIWFADRLASDPAAFVTADIVRFPAAVDPERLATAVTTALSELPGFHARIGGDDGDPWQEMPEDPTPAVPVLDMPDVETARRWAEDDSLRPMDPESGPLCRQAVLRIADGGTWWYQAAHHLATDGYATSLLFRRVAEIHGADDEVPSSRLRGTEVLIDLDAAYDGSERWAADRAYWEETLAGAEGAVGPDGEGALPMARPVRVRRTLASAPDPATAAGLVSLWLHRVTGRDDLTLGLLSMGRLGSPAARVPACWVNVLPLRVMVTPSDTLAALTERAGSAMADASRHGRHRYEDLRRAMGTLAGGRLVGTLLNIKPFLQEIALDGHPGVIENLSSGPVDDIAITIEGDRLLIEGHPDRYSPATLAAHAERIALALERGMAADPATPCGDIDILPASERDAELRHARGPRVPVPPGTLWSRFAEQADRTPDASAIEAADDTLTYAELRERAECVAGALAHRGAGPGEVVGIRMDRSAALFAALLGTLRTGAAYLPLEPDQPADRSAAMEESAQPVYVVDDVAALMAEGRRAPDREPEPDDLAYLLYTSGSTGKPKGVEVPHRAIVNRLAWIGPIHGFGPHDRVLLKTPLGFDVSVWELFWALTVGATVVVAPPGAHRDPSALAARISEGRVTITHFVPSMLKAFVAEPTAAECTGLRHIVCSGEALGSEVAGAALSLLPGVTLDNLYGPTEAAVDVTHWRVTPDDAEGIPIGRPVWNTDAVVLDPAGHPAAPGAVGELHLGGVQLARGYRGRPDLTAERFIPDPFGDPGDRLYRTGDLVSRRPDGALDYHGRADQQVKISGVRIELGEVEAALVRHPAVAQAAAMAREDRPGDKRLVAYVVPGPDDDVDPQDVRRHMAEILPSAMVPAAVMVLDALPTGPTGKLDRRSLPLPPTHEGEGPPPGSPVEERLCALFADVLGAARVGPEEGFFDLGGSSLAAARLVTRIRQEFGVSLGIGVVFASPTPAGLATQVAAGDDDGRGPVLDLRAGEGAPLVCVHPAGGLGWCYGPLAARLPEGRPVVTLQADDVEDESIDAIAARYVARLRERWPDGPVHLLGWSVGGVIAHAMATQLADEGRPAGALVLLDAYPSDQWSHLPPPTESDALEALLLMAGLSASDEPLTLEAVLKRLNDAGSALASLPPDAVERVARTVMRTAGLMRRAEHRTAPGDMLFITAAAPRSEDWLDREGWAPYIGGVIRNVDLPHTHPELVRAPAVEQIADLVAEHIAAAESVTA